jgi:hypothetical protein
MRRAATILLIVLFAALGSGAMLHVHNEDAGHHDDAQHQHHDERNCLVHALLGGPMLLDGVTPLLVCLGLFVAFLTLLASQPAPQKVLARLDCRGPPARLLIAA